MSLRPYQLEALETIKREREAGFHRQLIAMATGTGKTIIFSNLPEFLGVQGKVLILAHRDELIQQAAQKMRHWNPKYRVGIEMADEWASPNDRVIIASVATLGRADGKRLERFKNDEVDVVICDEAHHSIADTYMRIFGKFGFLSPDNKKLLVGFTATPNRGDGQAMAQVYDKIVYQYNIRKAIEDGWLSDVRGIRIKTNTRLDSVSTRMGDFVVSELENAVNTPERNKTIVEEWVEHGWPRPTLVFTVDIQHAKDLALMFQRHSVPAEAIWGNDPLRADKLAAHRAGKLTVLVNCNVLTEGYDDWRIGCIIMARPTKSQSLFVQMSGRGMRLQDGTGNLHEAIAQGIKLEKADCLLMDVVDNTSRHSLVTLPTIFGLSAHMDLRGKSVVGSVKAIEDAEKKHPSVDFTKLTDINRLDAYMQEVNLWEVKFAEEVTEHSQLRWCKRIDGSYILVLPDKERVVIKQNDFDMWVVEGSVKGQAIKQECRELPDAFRFAELFLSTFGRQYINLLRREWKSGADPMTTPQLNLLRKFYKGRPLPENLTKEQASGLISQYISNKAEV